MALTNIFKKENIKTTKIAKPSFRLIKEFAKGELEISGSTMDFMMYLSPYVDLDGKLNIPLEQVKNALNYQRSTFERVLREALIYRLLVKKGDSYFSNFHIHTDGSDHTRSYIQLLKVFTSAAIQNLNLREKRLFYYLVTSVVIGKWHSVHIENLYRNSLRNKETGVDYFYSFKEVADALVTLVASDLIEIELTPFTNGKPSGEEISVKKNKEEIFEPTIEKKLIESEIYTFFKVSDGKKKRKERTTLRKSRERVIQMRIAPKHVNNLVRVDASKEEFIRVANENSITWNKIENNSINYFIGIKNKLYKQAGEIGIKIYRDCLQKYLKEEAMNILYYAEQDKLANYFMDFYILSEIQSILVDAAKHQRNMQTAIIKNPACVWEFDIRNNTYRVNQTDLASLLAFFDEFASVDHKVLIDADFFENNIQRTDVQFNIDQWESLFKEVTTIFTEQKMHLERMEEGYYPIHSSNEDWRIFMHESAKNGLIKRQEEFKALLEQVRLSLLVPKEEPFIQSHSNRPSVKPVKVVEFYNWLEIRE